MAMKIFLGCIVAASLVWASYLANHDTGLPPSCYDKIMAQAAPGSFLVTHSKSTWLVDSDGRRTVYFCTDVPD